MTLLSFTPSSIILFGDPARKAMDSLRIELKYPQKNLNQSMFARIIKFGRCVRLESQHRFGENISRFLSKCYYSGHPIGYREFQHPKPLNAINIFHRTNDGFCFQWIRTLLKHINLKEYSLGIIHPPNVRRERVEIDSLG